MYNEGQKFWNLFFSKGDGAAVLIRSLEPVEGLDVMKKARRSTKNPENSLDKIKEHQLCNGPSKLTQVCVERILIS